MADRPRIKPRVSVIVAAWNAEGTILRAIESALAQSVPVEVVVVDDNSADETFALAQDRARDEDRLTVLRQPVNRGPSEARNRAIAVSSAPWITVLDSDDWMAPDRLERLLEIAEEHGADFVADDLWKLPEGAPWSDRAPLVGDLSGVVPLTAVDFITANLSSRRGGRRELGFLKPLMSRDFLRRHAMAYDPRIRLGEDYVLYARALMNGARFLLTEPLGYVAITRPGSLSGSHPTEAHAHLIAADRAMLERPDLPADIRRALSAHLMEQRKKLAWRQLIDAVRDGNRAGALRCFWAPPQIGMDLAGRLLKEAASRTRRRGSG